MISNFLAINDCFLFINDSNFGVFRGISLLDVMENTMLTEFSDDEDENNDNNSDDEPIKLEETDLGDIGLGIANNAVDSFTKINDFVKITAQITKARDKLGNRIKNISAKQKEAFKKVNLSH